MKKRIHLIISGDVVGVGYRSWVQRVARSMQLTGWVKNREAKAVELVAEGEKETLEHFIAACKKGPDVAWVNGVAVDWQPATQEFMDFRVVY